MKPTLRQMEYLVAIADTGTFGEAAKRTFVSQPSLSAQVKDMELHIGASLLERGRHGALLTPIGEEMVKRARIVLRQVEEMKVLGREAEGTLAGRVKLGVLPTVGPYLLPQATRKLHKAYPDLRLFVREERTVDLQDHLASGEFDVIISTPEDHLDTKTLPLVKENIYICVAPDDPLAESRKSVSITDLKGREFLTLGHGHKFTTVVQNLAGLAGATTSGEYEGTSLDTIRQMAAMGGSVAVLPSLYAISEAKRDPQLIVRPIDHPSAQRQISLIWRRSSPLANKFEKVGEVFTDVAASIMA
ncbi:hydrogen peroxide-inducible genes activator [Hellea balneolensis]|uniref:hydrogen peroxide-inducible genes activator n=1 Tax=Hellea balneolensis TaxID=287478 RepID=UPI00138B04F9|nr:hydrogen peroxide-inducible genes activator [Hellea balneolensis]